jgi:hypothetical protein
MPYSDAREVKDSLLAVGIPSHLSELEVDFQDRIPRFEVLVRPQDRMRAEQALDARWRALAEEEGLSTARDVALEACPACGAKVPLAVEECPECGLVVGLGEGEDTTPDVRGPAG